jgi:hypothetical protein
LKLEIEKRNSLIFKFVSFFSKPSSDVTEIEKEVTDVQETIAQLSENLSSLKNNAARIYDYFLTYPPDWDERREKVIKKYGNQCSNCNNWARLHLHHVVPLSKGGSNKIENLTLLCENCHSDSHGGRNLSCEFVKTETAFSKRVGNIRYAIAQRKRINFEYKKPTDIRHKKRTVKPTELIYIDHVRDSGKTLCVRGFCELRNAERTFALKRMKGLKVL